jgi:hypothetical protein
MCRYYFTFSENHFTKEGLSLGRYYVQVNSIDVVSAEVRFKEWVKNNMTSETAWSWIYAENEFNNYRDFFPSGMYAVLNDNKDGFTEALEKCLNNLDDLLKLTNKLTTKKLPKCS